MKFKKLYEGSHIYKSEDKKWEIRKRYYTWEVCKIISSDEEHIIGYANSLKQAKQMCIQNGGIK